ncbi:TPA: winged helix-turn-helix domain-containing protein [Serratia marcescens]|uniref:winged helix-turn-helix domain-containing protein n=1 Tax=Serratia TaxID=613 RepID=UPI001868729E|nr:MULTISPECIES: winged helix-turn-helix domain-containing protein [Serratia]MBH2855219.1 winged helix-turn-helix domain-containing protein [Serratia marcescens]MDB6450200.1 winged helix-turn-helix domain-containing protein [Serratia sp. 21NM0010]HEJ7129694.1 winged helix-turn-helix domain-containing protein [Serratia marcescens]
MKFIINGTIVYNEKEGTLERVNDDGSKTLLQNPTRRLLSIFVRNNGEIVHREKLLSDVWEEYGLKASNNNLNTYASSLRRSFARLGEEEILITYPRQGFMFAAGSIREEACVTNHHGVAINQQAQQSETRRFWYRICNKRLRGSVCALTIIFLLVLLLVEIVLFMGRMDQQPPMAMNIARKGMYKNCEIYIIKNESADLDEIGRAISRAGFDCSLSANVYYSGRADGQRMMLAYCPVDVLSPCKNSGAELPLQSEQKN